MGENAERSAGRVVHAARGLPSGHAARDATHRQDPQPDRAAPRTGGPRPAGAAGCDAMTDEEPTAEATPAEGTPAEGTPAADRPQKSGRSRRKRKSGRTEGRALQYWMVVSSPDNFRKTRELGFTIQGLKSRHRRRVETMRVGDRLLYYVTGRMSFAATVTVASPMYEDHTPTWRSARRDEDYPLRVHLRPDHVLDDTNWIPT